MVWLGEVRCCGKVRCCGGLCTCLKFPKKKAWTESIAYPEFAWALIMIVCQVCVM